MAIKLTPRTVFAMPVGPPFGGMTAYASMLRRSEVFRSSSAILFDTTPPASTGFAARFFESLRKLGALVATVRRNRVQVVYFMTSDYLGFYEKGLLAVCCRIAGTRTVLHPVGSFIDFYGSAGGSRALIRFLLRQASAVIVVQRQVEAFVARLAPQTPVWLIPNPFDSSQLTRNSARRAADGKIRILFIGALVKAKGILDLLEAVHLYQGELPNAVVTIVGKGDLFAECQRRIKAHHLEAIVEMKGFVDEEEKNCILTSSDIFCLPSHTEGTPISVLEAMGAGLPIVATHVGGIPSVVQHGLHGWLAAPGDVAALGRFLVHLVRHEAVRLMMGQNGLRRARGQYDIRVVADLFIARLNSLVNDTPAVPGKTLTVTNESTMERSANLL